MKAGSSAIHLPLSLDALNDDYSKEFVRLFSAAIVFNTHL
jgi:hypothetical protein